VAGRDERQVSAWPQSLGDSSQSLGEAAAEFASAVGWPLLADPLSGARRGAAAVAHYDALLRDDTFTAALDPDLVLRVGDLPVSKPLRAWLAGLQGTRQVALDAEGAWQDPASVLSDSFALEPAAALGELAAAAAPADESWLARWRSGDELAAEAILGVLAEDGLSEPAVAAELGVLLPEAATLFVASSMPVRDIETFWPIRADPPRVLCNRGANGIDGIVSSAFGAAAAADCPVDRVNPLGGAGVVDDINPIDGVNPVGGDGPVDGVNPVVLLIGDVALAHDLGGLLAARRLGLKLTIVLLDNEGGGIFDFLPVADAAVAREPEPFAQLADDIYTRHIATPTGLDFGVAASLYCLSHERVEDVRDFRAALERALARENSSIVEVRGTREANVDLHRRIWKAVAAALTA
jgi:2-succinyl-5-enolpyruvyl-6-hydroxy-3-cyclohexene-1-carboxylate synthase